MLVRRAGRCRDHRRVHAPQPAARAGRPRSPGRDLAGRGRAARCRQRPAGSMSTVRRGASPRACRCPAVASSPVTSRDLGRDRQRERRRPASHPLRPARRPAPGNGRPAAHRADAQQPLVECGAAPARRVPERRPEAVGNGRAAVALQHLRQRRPRDQPAAPHRAPDRCRRRPSARPRGSPPPARAGTAARGTMSLCSTPAVTVAGWG